MFIEPHMSGDRRGHIEVICGSMFSGKTEELIRRLRRAKIAKLKVEIFKPDIDLRYNRSEVVSHDLNSIYSTPIDNSQAILLRVADVDVVGIDEAQFFDDEIITVCERLALSGIRVIVAGLDMDFKGRPFGPIPKLLAIADFITKLHAICMRCGQLANVSYRKSSEEGQVLLGEQDHYEPRCRKCFHEGQN